MKVVTPQYKCNMPNVHDAFGFAIGLFLILAGLSKLYVQIQDNWLFGMHIGVTSAWAFIEILAGVLIAVYNSSFGAWFVLTIMMFIFVAIAAVNTWTGVAGCGCLGVVRARPSAMLGINIVLAAISAVFCYRQRKSRAPLGAAAFQALGIAAVVCFFSIAALLLWFSVDIQAIALGRKTITPKTAISVDDKENGIVALLPVKNLSDQPVEIIGIHSPCKTVCLLNLPHKILPGAVVYLPVRTTIPEDVETGDLVLTLFSPSFADLRFDHVWHVKRR